MTREEFRKKLAHVIGMGTEGDGENETLKIRLLVILQTQMLFEILEATKKNNLNHSEQALKAMMVDGQAFYTTGIGPKQSSDKLSESDSISPKESTVTISRKQLEDAWDANHTVNYAVGGSRCLAFAELAKALGFPEGE